MLVGALAGLRRHRRDRQPVGRALPAAPSPGGCLASSTPTSCSTAGPTSSPPAWWCCSSASASRRCSARPTWPQTIDAFDAVGRAGAVRHPLHRRDPVRARPAHLPVVPARPGGLVGALPQPLGPARPRRRRAPRGARRPTATRGGACSTSPSSSAAPLAGVGGAQLSTAYANAWFENMTQGRGFIAVRVVIFAARQPFKVAAGAYLFGAALALSPALQARGLRASTSSPSTPSPTS